MTKGRSKYGASNSDSCARDLKKILVLLDIPVLEHLKNRAKKAT